MDNEHLTNRQRDTLTIAQMKNERSSFEPYWRDLSDYFLPVRSRFFTSDANRGDRRNFQIVDSTGTTALRTLRSGMMSGVTSPARPWFRLTTPDPALAEVESVKAWLHVVGQRMTTVFMRSNLYNVLPTVYGDMSCFATSALYIEEDMRTIMRFISLPIGSYWLGLDNRGKVRLFYREWRMTVRQIVDEFARSKIDPTKIDWEVVSEHVKALWGEGQHDAWVDVGHIIQPNDKYNPNSSLSKHKRYSSRTFELGTSAKAGGYINSADESRYLREMGYDYFPVLCPRWEVTGEDIYGTDCPAMTCLGDVKALQTMHMRKAQAIEKMVNPPMTGPGSLAMVPSSILPGGTTWVDEVAGKGGFRPAHEVEPRVQELLLDIQDHQARIRKVCFEELFLMMSMTDRRDITAREIDERHEEKLLALGSVLEQLNQDLLDPLIDIAFYMMLQRGLVPEPPQEMQGVELKVEYISIMAQAQKLVAIGGIERFAGFANQFAAVAPEIIDKIDLDQMMDVYSDITSIPPGIVRPDEQVAAIRAQRAKQAQAMQAAENASQAAGAVRDLSQSPLEGENALTGLLKQAQAGAIV